MVYGQSYVLVFNDILNVLKQFFDLREDNIFGNAILFWL